MFRNSLFLLIISTFGLTGILLNEGSHILQWTLLSFTQQLIYIPILLLWFLCLIFIGIGLVQRYKKQVN